MKKRAKRRVNLFYDDGEHRNKEDSKLYNKPSPRVNGSRMTQLTCTKCGKEYKVSSVFATGSYVCDLCLTKQARG